MNSDNYFHLYIDNNKYTNDNKNDINTEINVRIKPGQYIDYDIKDLATNRPLLIKVIFRRTIDDKLCVTIIKKLECLNYRYVFKHHKYLFFVDQFNDHKFYDINGETEFYEISDGPVCMNQYTISNIQLPALVIGHSELLQDDDELHQQFTIKKLMPCNELMYCNNLCCIKSCRGSCEPYYTICSKENFTKKAVSK